MPFELSFFFSHWRKEREGLGKRKEGKGPVGMGKGPGGKGEELGGKREGPGGNGEGQEERGGKPVWAKCGAGLSVFSPNVTSFFRTLRLTISNFIHWFLEKEDYCY